MKEPRQSQAPRARSTTARKRVSAAATPAARAESSAGPETADHMPESLSRRAVVDRVRPQIDGGRFPIKRTAGERVVVVADVFADGHDLLAAVVRERSVPPGGLAGGGDGPWREHRMQPGAAGTDEWIGSFTVDQPGWHEYGVVAWVDRFSSWRRDLRLKSGAGQDVGVELEEGSLLVGEAAARAEQIDSGREHGRWLQARAAEFVGRAPAAERVALALDDELAGLMTIYEDRGDPTVSNPLRVWVDRERARFSSWYEMFPRSAGPDGRRSGTFSEAAELLPGIADLGFDVVYLPPVHPIGRAFRKGPNNNLVSRPGDPGSPWAIGSEEGGHDAIEPGLGTFDDFEAFRLTAERLGLEVALDLAWQCSPDHPWVRQHPAWFRHRPDGTIKYAENPPKKYQDIYPIDFSCADWRRLWQALFDVTWFWVGKGVRIFRVDNPHTKTFGFWEWMIREVQARDPGVIFLAEAFTRPKPMRYLAKAGFTQSYTYFTWRNTKDELTDYLTELTTTEVREYLRPNFFANTPDILHAYLQHGGPPAFRARLLLAATLAASYGIYSGFELCEGRAVPGTEEYLDSEKYQYRKWDFAAPGNIRELVAQVNGLRHRHPALQHNETLRFHATDNPQILAYSKTAPDDSETLLMVVNLDPHGMQHGFVHVPLDRIGVGPADLYVARDLLTEVEHPWRGERNYVRLDPEVRQGHILRLENRK